MKRFFAILMALVMCVALFAGCSSKEAAEPAAPAADSTEKADDTAAEEKVLKVGFIGPLTGATAQYGTAVQYGAKLYFDEINAAGGVDGVTVEFIPMDSTGDPAVAINCYNTLYDKGVACIIGPVLTGETQAVAPIADEDGMPLITASATGDDLSDLGDALFRTCFKDSFQGGKIADYAKEKLGFSKVAIITNNGSTYSTGLTLAFKNAAEANGLEIVAEEAYADGDTDFKAQLTNLSTLSFDAIYVPDYYETVALIAQQAKAQGIEAPFLGGDGYSGVLNMVEDKSVLEGFVYSDHYDAGASDAAAEFGEKYISEFDVDPLSFSFLAYDAAQIVVNAAGRIDELNPETMIAALPDTDMDCLTSHYVFDEDNNPIKSCAILQIKDGEVGFVTMF